MKPFNDPPEDFGKIGLWSLSQLRDQYKKALFERFIPAMDSCIIDHKFGGFMCDYDIASRSKLSSTKKTWSEGRGIWVYSFLYNHFGKNPHFFEIANKSKDFILKHQPPCNEFWESSFTKEGTPMGMPGDIYCNLYLAEGLTEFARASGEMQYLEMAKKIMLGALFRYDQDDYKFPVTYGPHGAPLITAPRVMGHWMVFLRAASLFLEQEQDADIKTLADRCVEAIMKHHLNKEYGLVNETLHHDFTLPDNEWALFSYFATGIQALWMVMAEAVRAKDAALFQDSVQVFKNHLEVAADPVYGGYFRSLDNVRLNTFKLDKVLSLQEEVLIGTLIIIEHTQDPFARRCFAETYAYIQHKFSHPEYEFTVESGDRKMAEFSKKGIGNYHHPRHLMMNLLPLERLAKRDGKPSALFN